MLVDWHDWVGLVCREVWQVKARELVMQFQIQVDERACIMALPISTAGI